MSVFKLPASATTVAALCSFFLIIAASCNPSPQGEAPASAEHEMKDASGEEQSGVPVEVALVETAVMTKRYATTATLRADQRATITARTSGVIQRLYPEEGNRVRQGALLAQLEDDSQQVAYERASATFESHEREANRLARLLEQNLVSEETYEQAQKQATDSQHAARLAELDLQHTRIRAPFSGVIVERHLDVGNTVSPGTAVYELADLEPLLAEVRVPERHVTGLDPGQEVRLIADATSTSLSGEIERIAPIVDPDTGTVNVTVAVENTKHVRPGAFVRVEIVTDVHPDALVVPREALVSEGDRLIVYRVSENPTVAHQVVVETGFEEEGRVEISSQEPEGALQAGSLVVVAGSGGLSDEDRVEVVSEDDDTAETDQQ